MAESSRTDNGKRSPLPRRLAVGSFFGLGAIGLLDKLSLTGKAYGQDAAAVVAALKLEFAGAIAVYEQYSKVANDFLGKTRTAVEGVQTLQNARKIISDQEAQNRALMNRFWEFGKNPLGATLPTIQFESQPIFRALAELAGYYDTLAASKAKNEAEKSGLYGKSRVDTGHALGKNDAIGTRKNINALGKTVGTINHPEKSRAELFRQESAPIAIEQSQAILECLLRIEGMMTDMYGAQFAGLSPRHRKYTAEESRKAVERHKGGLGTLAPDEAGN